MWCMLTIHVHLLTQEVFLLFSLNILSTICFRVKWFSKFIHYFSLFDVEAEKCRQADVKANYIEVFELGYQQNWSKEITKTWLVTPLSIYIINYCNFYYITNSFEVCIVLHSSSISAVGSKEALKAINIVMFFRRKWCVRTEKTLSPCPALEHATH